MKKVILIGVVIMALISGASFAKEGGHQGKSYWKSIQHHLDGVDTTDEQREQIKTLMDSLHEKIKPIQTESMSNRKAIKALVYSNNFDENEVARLAAAQGELTAKRIALSAQVRNQVFSILTPEQQNKTQSRHEKHKDKKEHGCDRQHGGAHMDF